MSFRFRSIWLLHIPLLLVGSTMLAPLLFMVTTALSPSGEEMQFKNNFLDLIIPRSWQWSNFVEVWQKVPFMRFYLNSIIISIIVTAGQVFTSACAAYSFSRMTWKWRDRIFFLYLGTLMIPGSVTMLPNFIAMKELPELLSSVAPWIDWGAIRHFGESRTDPVFGRLVGLDSYFALIIPGMFSAYGTFLLRQFFVSLPRELDEAAMIDGCSHWMIFRKVILPLSIPSLTTLSVFTFMGSWGSFLWPLIVTNQAELQTLPLGLMAFQGQYGTDWNLMMAASLMMLFPIIVIFLSCQRFFLSGLTVGAVKG